MSFCEKVMSQGSPKSSKLQYSHWDIAISTRCPKLPINGAKRYQKGSKMRPLGSQSMQSGAKWDPKGGKSATKMSKKVTLRNPGEPQATKIDPKGTKMEPKVTKMEPKVAKIAPRHQNQGLGMSGWNLDMQVVFAYPLPSTPTHFPPALIEHPSNSIGADPTPYIACGLTPLLPL